jgi:hypothetical protein
LSEREKLDGLLLRLLLPRVGHAPVRWPRRVYEIVERTALAQGTDPVALLGGLIRRPESGTGWSTP